MLAWFFDSPGIGSLVVFIIAFSVLMAYVRMLRWIQSTPRDAAPPADPPPGDASK